MSPELVAIITAAVIILGFLWNLHRDMAGIHRDIAGLHRDIAGVHRDVGDLRERMARLEGLFEGFTRREPPPPPATYPPVRAALSRLRPRQPRTAPVPAAGRVRQTWDASPAKTPVRPATGRTRPDLAPLQQASPPIGTLRAVIGRYLS